MAVDFLQWELTKLGAKRRVCFSPLHLKNIEAAWEALPSTFRLSVHAEYPSRKHLELSEVRLCPMKLHGPGWDDDSEEENVGIQFVSLTVDKLQLEISTTRMHLVSQHALARRFQRGRDSSDAAVISDIRALLRIDPDEMLAGKEFTVAVHDGQWRGSVLDVQPQDRDGPVKMAAVRTFVDT